MRVKINDRYYQLTDEELEFVRGLMGEWEEDSYEFNRPLQIPVTEIAEAKGLSRQAVLAYAKRNNIKLSQIGHNMFVSLDDALEHWFRSLR